MFWIGLLEGWSVRGQFAIENGRFFSRFGEVVLLNDYLPMAK
jgi:hypothetical protein